MATQEHPNPVTVASDTDESEPSSASEDHPEGAPLIEAVSDSEEEEKQSSMNDIDGDSDDDDDGSDKDKEGEEGEGDEEEEAEEEKEEERPEDEFTHATPLPCISNEPAGDYDWKEIVLARICMFGNAEVCVGAVILQTKDGTESGCADSHLSRHDMTKEKIKEKYILVDQPMGYVTRVTGYHSVPGKPCLLHSLRLEFASGQVIELQGETDAYKGEAFVVQDLDDNFYVSTIDFDQGKCIGYSGYHTERPLSELMEEESLPDEDVLDQAQEHSEYDDDDYSPTSRKSKMKPPTGADDSSWVKEELPAREHPQPPPEEDKTWRVSHIALCGGPCVRGCIMHYYNGRRFGYLLKEDLKQASINDHNTLDDANGRFVEVRQPGGYITKINGYQMGEDCPHYLCHSLQLEFESGQVIEFKGHSDAEVWKGKYFSYTAPEDFYINQIKFDGDGHVSSVHGIRTEEMNFPPMEVPEIDEGGKKKCCFCC